MRSQHVTPRAQKPNKTFSSQQIPKLSPGIHQQGRPCILATARKQGTDMLELEKYLTAISTTNAGIILLFRYYTTRTEEK
jgi:hypothetical protein